MTDLIITREFRAGIDHVFRYISDPAHILEWWGPQGVSVPIHDLSLGKAGPWMSEMHAPDGRIFKVSGHVTRVDPPRAVGFTWAWHGEDGTRGHESHVLIELEARGDITQFTLTHAGLPDDDARASHSEGWTSSLVKLEQKF